MKRRGDHSGNWATLSGLVAILIWASLSLLTHFSGHLPPFQLVAMSFFVATLLGIVLIVFQGLDPWLRRLNVKALLLGVGGLFGYHFFFFLALRQAPILEATLINYLWPLLIVLFSVLLPVGPDEGGLRRGHVAGACLGLAGAALVLFAKAGGSDGEGTLGGPGAWWGYAAALAAALIWASYSVASRLFSKVPTQAVTLYCFLTMLAAGLAHMWFETTIWPASKTAWMAVLMLGLGPVGGAFYFWDFAMKRGDIRLLGVLSYFVPLLSILLLIAAGISTPKPLIWLAAILIILGALVAAKDNTNRPRY